LAQAPLGDENLKNADRVRVHSFQAVGENKDERMRKMKQDEKKPIPWEVADPKPPVIQSGRMENRKAN
jgi:hypothetical protein